MLSAAVLASVVGMSGTALGADSEEDREGSRPSAGLLDPAGSAVGTLTGTDRPSGASSGSGGSSDAGDGVSTRGADAEPAGRSTDVTLAEKNDSGASGTATVTTEKVVGTATGLDPDARYVSFFYGATSSATNNNPCILDGTNPLPSDQTVGEWDVDENGKGTLSADNPLGARYPLQAGTMSIRKVEHDFSRATALPVNPASYSLVACGEVERIAALDTVTDQVPELPQLPSVPPVS